jgi:tetratricopeptide (TPR) repeat protein
MGDDRRRSARGAALAVALLFGVGALPVNAAQRWIVLNTPHFEMYTDNSAREGMRALGEFEQVRSFFLQISGPRSADSPSEPDQPVRIIAFRSEKEFAPYRINPGVFAYYQRSRQRDYIVMQDINPEHYGVAVHEYTHLIVQHAGLRLPVWLNEGLAELYSSLEPKGDEAMVGRPPAEESEVMARETWLDLAALTSATLESPYYNERNMMSIFYAQSWLLTHMLALSAEYRSKFSKFVAAVAGGAPSGKAFAAIYQKNLDQVAEDLRTYFERTTVCASLFPIKLEKADEKPEVRNLPPFESELVLADLLASHRSTAGLARRRLNDLARKEPGNPRIQESLGYLSWQEGDADGARTRFASAFREGSSDAQMLYHYASLAGSNSGDRGEAISSLTRALEVKPDFEKARLALGMELMDAKLYGRALSTLSEMQAVKPDQAFSVFSSLAFCSLKLKSPENARMWEEKAVSYATKASEREQAATFLRYLDTFDATNGFGAGGSR